MSEPKALIGVPIKPFGVAKQRLDRRLSAAQRSALGKAVAAHTVTTARSTGEEVVVVTGHGEVAEWAGTLGVEAIPEGAPGTGLNGAGASLRDLALRRGSAWLVLHADLPSLAPSDVAALLDDLSAGPVIAPSYDAGTTALGARVHADFAYGPGSFHRHLRALPGASVVTRPGLAFDLDTVDDLDTAAKANPWIAAALDSPP